MIKRFLVFLLALAALGGGVYVLKGRKTSEQVILNTSFRADDAPIQSYKTLPAPPSPQVRQPISVRDSRSDTWQPAIVTPVRKGRSGYTATFVTTRVAVLFLVAGILGGLAYVGLGESPYVAANLESTPASRTLLAREATSYVTDDSDMLALKSSANAARLAAIPTASPAPVVEAAPPEPTPAVASDISEPPAPEAAAQPAAAEPAPVVQVPADGIEAIVCSVPWPCAEAIAVARCESGTDMNGRLDGNWAANGIHYGLFQISAIHAYKWADFYDKWMDPASNVQWAYQIYSEAGGWGPWQCKPWY